MGARVPWPPSTFVRDGVEYIRIILGPRRCRERSLGPVGSEEARREYLRIVSEMEAGQRSPDPASRTVAEIVADFVTEMRAEQDWRSFAHTKATVGPIVRLYGHTYASEFGPVALRTCREQWVKEGYCRNSCNRFANITRRLFRWAASRELCSADIAFRLKTVEPLRRGKTQAHETPEVPPAKDEDIDRTLPHLTTVVADMVRLQRLTGMRPGEVCAVRPVDIERPWRTVGDVALWLYRMGEHKTRWRGERRWIPIGPRAQALLTPYLERDPITYCFSPMESYVQWCAMAGRKPNLKRKRLPGDQYATEIYDRNIARACERAGVKWTPNQIRHTAGTQVNTEHSREDARAFLGHKHISTTAIYAEDIERAAQIAAKMG